MEALQASALPLGDATGEDYAKRAHNEQGFFLVFSEKSVCSFLGVFSVRFFRGQDFYFTWFFCFFPVLFRGDYNGESGYGCLSNCKNFR
jgi:hypothetical protein